MHAHLFAWLAVLTSVVSSASLVAATYEDRVRAEETSTGEVYPDGSQRVGQTFSGHARGDLPGTFMLTVNSQPGNFAPDGTNTIVGGNWELVLEDGTSLFGEVTGGTIEWNGRATRATITVTLLIFDTSGTTGSGSFEGRIDYRGDHRLRGDLTLSDEPPATL